LSWIQLITRTQKEAAFIYKTTPERPKHEPSHKKPNASRSAAAQQKIYNKIPGKSQALRSEAQEVEAPVTPLQSPPQQSTII